MTLHLFLCDHCDQKPPIGATTCGACGRRVTFLNWIGTHLVLLVGIVFAGVYLIAR